jgi:sugar-specific transcriptional regulator TrmB
MEVEKILREAGLAGNEAKVYTALLDLGSVTAGEIAKSSGVNRTNVYDALRSLADKGLVGHVKKAERMYFEAASPHKFLHYLEEREEEVRERRQALEEIVPELETKRTLSKEQQEAAVYTGVKGLKTVAEDVLRSGDELLVFGAEGHFMEIFRTYSRNWHMRRANARVHMKIIYSDRLRALKSREPLPFSEMRFNPMLYDVPSTTWVYGDKTALIIWSRHVVATVIRSSEVASSYRQFFRALWRGSRGPSLHLP